MTDDEIRKQVERMVNEQVGPGWYVWWIIVGIILATIISALLGCTHYQPPGGGLSAVVAHTEAQRKP